MEQIMRRWSAAAVFVLALVASCSNADSTSVSAPQAESSAATTSLPPTTTEQAATTTSSSTTTSSTSTTDAPQTPGEHYLEIVAPMNCALQLLQLTEAPFLSDGQISSREWPDYAATALPAYAGLAQAMAQFVQDLVNYEWPEDVRADIDTLIVENSTMAAFLETVSKVRNIAEWNAVWEGAPATTGTADIVRARLGLPTTIGDANNWCDGQFFGR